MDRAAHATGAEAKALGASRAGLAGNPAPETRNLRRGRKRERERGTGHEFRATVCFALVDRPSPVVTVSWLLEA